MQAAAINLTRDAGPKPHGVFSASPRKPRAGPTSINWINSNTVVVQHVHTRVHERSRTDILHSALVSFFTNVKRCGFAARCPIYTLELVLD